MTKKFPKIKKKFHYFFSDKKLTKLRKLAHQKKKKTLGTTVYELRVHFWGISHNISFFNCFWFALVFHLVLISSIPTPMGLIFVRTFNLQYG